MSIIVSALISIVVVYLAIGFLFAIIFVITGVDKIDENVHGSTWGFRAIIFPGSVLLWPVLLNKWIRTKRKNSSHSEK